MARSLRIEYPGAFYHVINRGNAREKVFVSDRDREKFLEYLHAASDRFSLIVHTYCLMDNHYHLLVETPEANISKAIQWLNVSYAVYFNRKRGRNGHLFQGRFKAYVIDADEYLHALSRYIHLNPVRATLVDKPGMYPWSSYNALTGRTKVPEWLEVGYLLGHFHKTEAKAMQLFRKFCEEVEGKFLEDLSKNAVQGCIVGNENFVTWIQKKLPLFKSGEREIPQLKKLKLRPTMDTIVQEVREEFGCEVEDILRAGKKRNIAREAAIYLSQLHAGVTGKAVGEYFGRISGARISAVLRKVKLEIETHSSLKKKIEHVVTRIVNN
jgi:REP element-mobilizing transposase RayT